MIPSWYLLWKYMLVFCFNTFMHFHGSRKLMTPSTMEIDDTEEKKKGRKNTERGTFSREHEKWFSIICRKVKPCWLQRCVWKTPPFRLCSHTLCWWMIRISHKRRHKDSKWLNSKASLSLSLSHSHSHSPMWVRNCVFCAFTLHRVHSRLHSSRGSKQAGNERKLSFKAGKWKEDGHESKTEWGLIQRWMTTKACYEATFSLTPNAHHVNAT